MTEILILILMILNDEILGRRIRAKKLTKLGF